MPINVENIPGPQLFQSSQRQSRRVVTVKYPFGNTVMKGAKKVRRLYHGRYWPVLPALRQTLTLFEREGQLENTKGI